MYYEAAEGMARESLEKLQTERLKRTVATCLRSPFYSGRLGELNLTPDDFNSPADIAKIPFTTKNDLRANYPYGFLCQPMDQYVRLHASSGTTGTPTAIFYTQNDIDSWAGLWRAACTPSACARAMCSRT